MANSIAEETELAELLAEAASLSESGGAPDWARALRRAREEYLADAEAGSVTVKSMFGGMGSFNDLVLVRGDTALGAENDRLEWIRDRLFEILQNRHASGEAYPD